MTKEFSILNKVRKVLTKDAPVELDSFVLIDVESLSLDDKFMQYTPVTDIEKNLKALITKAIITKEKNFYKSIYDPSLIVRQTNEGPVFRLSFVPNAYPATYSDHFYNDENSIFNRDRIYNWSNECYKMAQKYSPDFNSKIGTTLQYASFLGVLIKELAKTDGVALAWHYVCRNSRKLGCYNRNKMSLTGKKCICGFYDLANTRKLLDVDYQPNEELDSSYYLASGYCNSKSKDCPIATIEPASPVVYRPLTTWNHSLFPFPTNNEYHYVPWVVLFKDTKDM